MKVYSGKVRLKAGEQLSLVVNEVPKIEMTAAEIMVLRAMHGGSDAVVDIKETGTIKRTDAEERERLARVYTRDGVNRVGAQILRDLFGPAHMALPAELPENDPHLEAKPKKRQSKMGQMIDAREAARQEEAPTDDFLTA